MAPGVSQLPVQSAFFYEDTGGQTGVHLGLARPHPRLVPPQRLCCQIRSCSQVPGVSHLWAHRAFLGGSTDDTFPIGSAGASLDPKEFQLRICEVLMSKPSAGLDRRLSLQSPVPSPQSPTWISILKFSCPFWKMPTPGLLALTLPRGQETTPRREMPTGGGAGAQAQRGAGVSRCHRAATSRWSPAPCHCGEPRPSVTRSACFSRIDAHTDLRSQQAQLLAVAAGFVLFKFFFFFI